MLALSTNVSKPILPKKMFLALLLSCRMGIKTETKNSNYSLITTKKATFNYAVSKQIYLKSFVGGVFVIPAQKLSQMFLKIK